MEIDFHRTCKFSFFDTAIGDVLRAIDGKSLMGSMILSFCVIDYMAQANSSNWSGNREDFKNYVSDHLGKVNEKYKVLREEIYAIRNSLIHSYGESDSSRRLNLQFLFSTTVYEKCHLDIKDEDGEKIIYFDLPQFVAEVIISVINFFEENSENQSFFEDWYHRKIRTQYFKLFHKRDFSALNITFPFNKIHNSLTFFNENDFKDGSSVSRYANVIRKQCCS